MFQKVVWATDGSDAADQALPVARTLAADGHGELLVVHVAESMLQTGAKSPPSIPVRANEEELKAKIEGQVAELSKVRDPGGT